MYLKIISGLHLNFFLCCTHLYERAFVHQNKIAQNPEEDWHWSQQRKHCCIVLNIFMLMCWTRSVENKNTWVLYTACSASHATGYCLSTICNLNLRWPHPSHPKESQKRSGWYEEETQMSRSFRTRLPRRRGSHSGGVNSSSWQFQRSLRYFSSPRRIKGG